MKIKKTNKRNLPFKQETVLPFGEIEKRINNIRRNSLIDACGLYYYKK